MLKVVIIILPFNRKKNGVKDWGKKRHRHFDGEKADIFNARNLL